MIEKDVLIIGAGPVGIFAAFQAGMLGMSSCVVDVLDEIGGQCTSLYPEKPIYDIPVYKEISGQHLIDQLMLQASSFNPHYMMGQKVMSVKGAGWGFEVATSKDNIIKAKVIIIAAGAGCFGPNRPPLEGIEEFEGKSIFYSVINKKDFEDKSIVIAGGGDSALDWAIELAGSAKQIYIVHRRDKFRAAAASVAKIKSLAEQKKIELVTGYQLGSLKGQNGKLDSVEIKDLKGNTKSLPADILLPFFGLKQELGPIADWGLGIHNHHIKVDIPHCSTNISGIYAVGDIATYDSKLKLILTGFSECASALHHAYGRVFDGKALHFTYSTTKGIPGS